ncbi:MAG: FtsH protease activity modulator HflK [Candidatus Micrarchaeota archaeon]
MENLGQNEVPPQEEKPQRRVNLDKYGRLLRGWLRSSWKVTQRVISQFLILINYLRRAETFKVKEDIRAAFGHLRMQRIAMMGVGVLLLMYLVSGFYMVNPGEEAVERLFGRVVKEGITEGLRYRLPWPLQQVDKVNVSEIRSEGVGLILPEDKVLHSSPEKIQILTGDENIVDLQLVIQYRITDPAKYLFKIDYRDCLLINEATRYAVTGIGSNMLVDKILTVAKDEIQRMVQSEIQSLLDAYDSGLTIVTVNINKMYPPDEVAGAFLDVASAREDRLRTVSEAESYRNSLIPPAKGEAERLLREAEGYQVSTVNQTQGDTERFLQMLAEYQKRDGNPSSNITRTRLYLETMEKILPGVKKYIVDSAKGGKVNLRFFENARD